MHLHVEQLVHRLLPAVGPGRALSDSEWRTLAKAAETFLEDAPVDFPGAQVADNAELFFAIGKSRRMWRIRLLLNLVELLPLSTHGCRFSELSAEQRRDVAEKHLSSDRFPWRVAGKVRFLVYLGAYGDPRAAAPTGFVPVEERERFVAVQRKSSGGAIRAVV